MSKKSKSIGEIMSKGKLETIDISSTALEAAKKMHGKNVGSLLVVSNDKQAKGLAAYAGIVTERDLARRVCVNNSRASEVPLGQIISSPITTIDPNSTPEVAAASMINNKVRHLLVVDKDRKELGMVTASDLAAYLRENLEMDEVNATILRAIEEEQYGYNL